MPLQKDILMLVCCLGVLWGCPSKPETEESADLVDKVAEVLPAQPAEPVVVTAAPTMARTVFANEWVGVAHVNLPPGELIPPHKAGVRFALPLSGFTLSVIDKSGEEVVHIVPGELATWPAGLLSLANVDESESDFLIVERNAEPTVPDLRTLAIPDVATDMERHGTVLLDDKNVLAVDITLDQLTESPLPPNLPLLVIAMSDCELEFQGAAVTDADRVMKAGTAIWEPAGYDVVSNVGDAVAHAVVLGFRK